VRPLETAKDDRSERESPSGGNSRSRFGWPLRRWRELVLTVLSVGIAFLLAEIAFRFYLRRQARADLERVDRQALLVSVDTCKLGDIIRLSNQRDLFYELKPNLRGRYCGGVVTTNALGMRMSSEPKLDKPAHVLRIVALGDSFLFGQGVDDGRGFLEVLQATMIAEGRPVELLNFGVPGYNTWMESVVLAARAQHYDPDVVIVAIVGNDWDLPDLMLSRPYAALSRSFLISALAERFRAPPEFLHTPRSRVYEDHYLAVPEEVPEVYRHMVGFDAYRVALSRMLAIVQNLDARIVLFSDCVAPANPGGESCRFPFKPGEYERVRDEIYANPRVTLCPWQLSAKLLIPRDGHPTPEGHRAMAEQLRSCLKRHGIER
jgi:lysophospholipase L1-like esterase